MMSFLFGAFVGLCVYLMCDGYMALRERRRRLDDEIDRHY